MKILLIDADSKIPNIPLMKLSTWHKSKGDNVELFRCNLPYYPNKKKHTYFVQDEYDKVYCSVIFDGNKEHIIGKNIIFGGTGVDLTTNLPDNIDSLECDYSIYPDNDTSYGFISRGCIRNCSFCKVPKKEGYIHQVNTIDNIIRHKKVKFLDNNFLALPNHKKILQELISLKVKCQFNQALDFRLLDKDNSYLLSKLNYLGDYTFAFDSWKYKNIMEEKFKLIEWRKPFQLKFFVYINPSMEISETVKRINWLRQKQCLPYIMRDITCWNSEYSQFYIDIAAYCNQPNLFRKMSFGEFLEKRHIKNKDRVNKHKELYYSNL